LGVGRGSNGHYGSTPGRDSIYMYKSGKRRGQECINIRMQATTKSAWSDI